MSSDRETAADAGCGRTNKPAAPARLFALLSSIYLCKPSRAALGAWRSLLEDSALGGGAAELRRALSTVDLDSEQALENLLWEYTRLFIGPYKLPCPPLESVYTSPARLMMQEAYDDVGGMYKRAGLDLGKGEVMYDHIGAELNFIAVLLDRLTSAPGDSSLNNELIAQFAAEHLKNWVPLFVDDLDKATDAPFYKALAQTTRLAIGTL